MSSHNRARPQRREDFEIAVVCALPLEYDAATLAFDEFWDEDAEQFGRAPGDHNTYTTGRIGQHDVVLALLSSMGKVSAAGAATALRSSYTGLKLAVLSGVCGGVPGEEAEIVLGDVIVSRTVIQYDLGRQYPGRFARKDTIDDNLGRPSQHVRSLLAVLQTEFGLARLERGSATALGHIQQKAIDNRRRTRYDRPPAATDVLFRPDYLHVHRGGSECGCGIAEVCDAATKASCAELGCDEEGYAKRGEAEGAPRVYVGDVASGDTVMKSGEHRDRVARELGVIGFEMEGAGVWDQVPCIVVKGVCDYADSHKNKKWQPYAAAVAAATTRALLERYAQADKRVTEPANVAAKDTARDAKDAPTSPARAAAGHVITNHGSGSQFMHTGTGNQNINTGSGRQYNADTMHF